MACGNTYSVTRLNSHIKMFPVDCLPEMSLQGCPVILPISQTLTSHMLNARYLTSSYERKDEMNTSYHQTTSY
ncbi:hypothetical protein NUKP82_39530 [Klebsiella variicola]|nr:hypothetical protein NUKP82_39530 [Klebsiella variicola]GKN49539.1 hypothetical protein NUKP84_42580 [Klebsiella variicola]